MPGMQGAELRLLLHATGTAEDIGSNVDLPRHVRQMASDADAESQVLEKSGFPGPFFPINRL